MKFHAMILAAGLLITGSANAVNYTLLPTATQNLGSFGANEVYFDTFQVDSAGPIDHSLTFNINQPLYAGSGVFDIPVNISVASFTLDVKNINNLSADIYLGNSLTPYTSFDVSGGNPDHLTLPANSLFGVGNYTLKIMGTATGSVGGTYAVAAVTVPVPEPETWAMLLVGLGLVGFRLRQKALAAQ